MIDIVFLIIMVALAILLHHKIVRPFIDKSGYPSYQVQQYLYKNDLILMESQIVAINKSPFSDSSILHYKSKLLNYTTVHKITANNSSNTKHEIVWLAHVKYFSFYYKDTYTFYHNGQYQSYNI